jgi:hypothetical protein
MLAKERVQMLPKMHELVAFVLRLHKDKMQDRSLPSTAPQFRQGARGLFLRCQLNRIRYTLGEVKDRPLGLFTVLDKIGA